MQPELPFKHLLSPGTRLSLPGRRGRKEGKTDYEEGGKVHMKDDGRQTATVNGWESEIERERESSDLPTLCII